MTTVRLLALLALSALAGCPPEPWNESIMACARACLPENVASMGPSGCVAEFRGRAQVMGEASRKTRARHELLDELAEELRVHRWMLPQVLQELLARGVPLGEERLPAPAPKDCPGCNFARDYGADDGVPSALAELILAHVHARHGDLAHGGTVGRADLPLEALPALALAKGLAMTTSGPWLIVLQHLEGSFLLSIQMQARRSTGADLGGIVARLGAPPEPLVPLDKLPPDHAIVWRWSAPIAPGGLAPGVDDAN